MITLVSSYAQGRELSEGLDIIFLLLMWIKMKCLIPQKCHLKLIYSLKYGKNAPTLLLESKM